MTSVADALLAAALGVDAIGLIFHKPSARNVTLSMANSIALSLPPFISRVGVIVNEDQATILEILNQVPLDILQFHGSESADFCRSFGKPYIKTIHVTGPMDTDFVSKYDDALAFLFDSKIDTLPGGSGLPFNWDYIPRTIEKPIILAGGLNSKNVSEAIQTVKPYAVDVTSGIEKSKGIKDLRKMQQFIDKITTTSCS